MTEQKTEPTVEYKNGIYWMTNKRGRSFAAESVNGVVTIEADSPLNPEGINYLKQRLIIYESDLVALLREMGWTVEPLGRDRQ